MKSEIQSKHSQTIWIKTRYLAETKFVIQNSILKIRSIFKNKGGEGGMLNKVGKIEEGGYHAAKYILYDDETGETLAASSAECIKLIEADKLVGLVANGRSVKTNHFYKWKGLVGEGEPEVWTVVQRLIDSKRISYKLSDRVGNTRIVSAAELEKIIDEGERVNGALKRKNGMMVAKKIPSKFIRNKEASHEKP